MAKDRITIYSELVSSTTARTFSHDDSRLEQRPSPVGSVALDKMRKSIVGFSEVMSQLLSSIPQPKDGFQVAEVQVHAFIDIEGGIQLLGAKLGGSVEGGLRFVWKRLS